MISTNRLVSTSTYLTQGIVTMYECQNICCLSRWVGWGRWTLRGGSHPKLGEITANGYRIEGKANEATVPRLSSMAWANLHHPYQKDMQEGNRSTFTCTSVCTPVYTVLAHLSVPHLHTCLHCTCTPVCTAAMICCNRLVRIDLRNQI
jgi:hypothetical protein